MSLNSHYSYRERMRMDQSKRPDLLLNSNFLVNIGSDTYSFARIKNISSTIDTEVIREGGNNWSVHTLVKPQSQSQKLILEHGFKTDSKWGPQNELGIGTRLYNVTIMVMQKGSMKKSYYFNEGLIVRWQLSDLDALQAQITYETVEIQHTGLREGTPQ